MRWSALVVLAMLVWPVAPTAHAQDRLLDNISTDAQCAHDILLSVIRHAKFCEGLSLPFDAVIESSLKNTGDYIVENSNPPVSRRFLEQRRVEFLTNTDNHQDCNGFVYPIIREIRLHSIDVTSRIDRLLSTKRVVQYDAEKHGCFR